MNGMRQKIQYSLALGPGGRGEPPVSGHQGAEPFVAKPAPESSAVTEQLMEEVCNRENLVRAWKRVRQNKGGPGVDGMTIDDAKDYLREHWPSIRSQLLAGTYQPQPVKRVEIPKPDGGVRKLGVPCVVDRLVQQALLQVLQKRWDTTFSKHSYGFRPGRSAHQAVAQAQQYIAAGYSVVVDLDLEKFLDCSSDYPPIPGGTAKRSGGVSVTLIRKPFRRPSRMWTACSSPRFTRCRTVWRETPSRFVASIMGMKPRGAFSTKRLRRSSVMRICQGAPGVGCSAGMKPSSIQRSTVAGARFSTSAALRTVSGSLSGVPDGLSRQGMPRCWRRA